MTDPIFVRSSTHYESYADFWRLVELSGFKAVNKGNVDLSLNALYIWPEMNGDSIWYLQDRPKVQRRARTVFWNLERPDTRASKTIDAKTWWQAGLDETFELVDVVWVSDKAILAMDPRPIWVCFGGHPGLFELPQVLEETVGPLYDVAHLGQRTPRRESVIQDLERRGISVSPNAWGDERARILSNSKLMLGIERLEGAHISAPLRWVVAAAYKLPIVQELHPDPAPLVAGESVLMAPIDGLADLVEVSLKQDLKPIGVAAWKAFCEKYTFRGQVEEAVGRIVSGRGAYS
jgi:hypothetical protein